MSEEITADHLYLQLCDRKVKFKVDMNVKLGKREVFFKVIKKEELQVERPTYQRLLAERFTRKDLHKKPLKPLETTIILTKWHGQIIATIDGWHNTVESYHVPYDLYPKIRTALK